MATHGHTVLQLTLILVSITMCMSGGWPGYEHFFWIDKHWPDLSCHPAYEADHRRNGSLMLNKHRWVDCLEQEKETGVCPKLCVLRGNMVYRSKGEKKGAKDPVIVDISSLSHHFRVENGYWDGLGGQAAEDLIRKVEHELKQCKEKHTEITNMPMEVPCDKWNPFLSCIEKAFGCA